MRGRKWVKVIEAKTGKYEGSAGGQNMCCVPITLRLATVTDMSDMSSFIEKPTSTSIFKMPPGQQYQQYLGTYYTCKY